MYIKRYRRCWRLSASGLSCCIPVDLRWTLKRMNGLTVFLLLSLSLGKTLVSANFYYNDPYYAHVSLLTNTVQYLKGQVFELNGDVANLKGRVAALENLAPLKCTKVSGFSTLVYRQSCYQVFVTPRNFADAKAACEAFPGGKLVEIESAGENNFLKSFTGLGGVAYWLGGSDQATEGTFRWLSAGAAPFNTFTDWAGGQPDNAGGNEDCLEIRLPSPFNSQWNDNACTELNRYVCEIDTTS